MFLQTLEFFCQENCSNITRTFDHLNRKQICWNFSKTHTETNGGTKKPEVKTKKSEYGRGLLADDVDEKHYSSVAVAVVVWEMVMVMLLLRYMFTHIIPLPDNNISNSGERKSYSFGCSFSHVWLPYTVHWNGWVADKTTSLSFSLTLCAQFLLLKKLVLYGGGRIARKRLVSFLSLFSFPLV